MSRWTCQKDMTSERICIEHTIGDEEPDLEGGQAPG